jgi:uncharacterized membrane protein
MKLEQYKLILISIGLIGALLIAAPAISGILSSPQGERFSELYLLGPERMAQGYPRDIVPNQNYTIYFDVVNHVGSSAYYFVYIKFLNDSDSLPDVTSGVASPAQTLYKNRILISDEHTSEIPLTFSISNTAVSNKQLTIGNLHLNGEDSSVNKAAAWNSTTSEYQYKLLFELFIYNSQSHTADFNNRFVYLQLNCSSKP